MKTKDSKKSTFADLLIKYMRRSRVGNADIAIEMGVTRQMVAKYKESLCKPQCDKVKKCAEFLRLTPEETKAFLETISLDCVSDQPFEIDDNWVTSLFPAFIQSLLNQITTIRPSIILLLTQMGWDEPPCREVLLVRAKERYSPDKVLHIFPPYCSQGNVDHYFVELAQQCGFKEVANDAGFERQLEERLCQVDQLFLLISRFEQIPTLELQNKFAGIIRSLTERYKNLHVLLCGNQKLENLKFSNGTLSLLNVASIERWPELGKTEIFALCKQAFPKVQLTEVDVHQILKLSGGHPGLLRACLNIKQIAPNLSYAKYNDEFLSENKYIWQSFTPYCHDNEMRKQLLEWLEKDCLGQKQPYIINQLLRELYWKNLLVNRDGQLCWRCEAIRMIGKKVLQSA